jgi:hypothetical protein
VDFFGVDLGVQFKHPAVVARVAPCGA